MADPIDFKCAACGAAPTHPCKSNGKVREPHGDRVSQYDRWMEWWYGDEPMVNPDASHQFEDKTKPFG